MKLDINKASSFQGKHIPKGCSLIGTSALVQGLDIAVPVRKPICVSARRINKTTKAMGDWLIFDKQYAVENNIPAHLVFALRHETLDLLVFKRIFQAIPEQVLIDYVNSAPTGPLVRRIWFLYEYLTGLVLDLPNSGKFPYVDLLDRNKHFTSKGMLSTRHRVRNNLLGNSQFCPIIRRTEILKSFQEKLLSVQVRGILNQVNSMLLARAASFLLLADTQASFAIEGERLPINTQEHWLKAVQQAGKYQLSLEEIKRLHNILIGDNRFFKAGLRDDFVFLGQRTIDNEPLPEFIGANPQDLENLIAGLVEANKTMSEDAIDPIAQAAAISFGFVYIHPFEDGNGRLHRCLIHHILAERQFSPPGLVFPISSVMLKWIERYQKVLTDHSKPLMQCIDWTPTAKGNVDVRNDTIDLYRYPDCTSAAEFLYLCVEETINTDIPYEFDYLQRYDKTMHAITNTVAMPNRLADNFIMFMQQNNWNLAKKRRQNEFRELTDTEIETLQEIVREAFEGFRST